MFFQTFSLCTLIIFGYCLQLTAPVVHQWKEVPNALSSPHGRQFSVTSFIENVLHQARCRRSQGFVIEDGKCYRYCGEAATWEDAMINCVVKFRGSLWTPNLSDPYLGNKVQQASVLCDSTRFFWIGLRNNTNINGVDVSNAFHMQRSQLLYRSLSEDQQCGVLAYHGTSVLIFYTYCNNVQTLFPYLCQINV